MRFYLAGTALAATWLTLSQLHRLHSCDSLVFSLASLYEWTPFFWEQDRVGMLLPLVASPIRHPMANLLVISGVMSFCGLLAPLLMVRLVCPQRHAYAAVTLGNALMVAFGPGVLQENLYLTCVYPLALCLGLPAVGLLDRPTSGRIVVAGLLLLLAHWTYLGVAVFLGPLAVGRWVVHPSWRRGWAAGRVLAVSTVCGGVMLMLAAEWRRRHPETIHTPATGLPMADWPRAWYGFLGSFASFDRSILWATAVGVVALIGCLLPFGRATRASVARLVLPLGLAAGAELLVIGTRAWPAMNGYHPRYLLASITAVWAGVLVVGLLPVLRNRVPTRGSLVAGFAMLAAAIGWRYGPPSPAAARAGLDLATGTDSAALLASGFDGIGGEYMWAWPAVFQTNLMLYERGERRVVVGVTSRSAPWVHRWAAGERPGAFRVAAPSDQEEIARKWIATYGLIVTGPAERCGRLIVLTVRPAD